MYILRTAQEGAQYASPPPNSRCWAKGISEAFTECWDVVYTKYVQCLSSRVSVWMDMYHGKSIREN